jgi:hypothetical protein
MLAAPSRLGSASRDRVGAVVSRVGHAATWPHAAERDSLRRVPACNFRRPAGKPCSARRRTPHAGTRMLPRPIATPVLSTIPYMKAAPLARNRCRHCVPKEDPESLFFSAERGFSSLSERRDSSFRGFFMLQIPASFQVRQAARRISAPLLSTAGWLPRDHIARASLSPCEAFERKHDFPQHPKEKRHSERASASCP